MTTGNPDFIAYLKAEIEQRRMHLAQFENGTMQMRARVFGGDWQDITAKTIQDIKDEISSLQSVIDNHR